MATRLPANNKFIRAIARMNVANAVITVGGNQPTSISLDIYPVGVTYDEISLLNSVQFGGVMDKQINGLTVQLSMFINNQQPTQCSGQTPITNLPTYSTISSGHWGFPSLPIGTSPTFQFKPDGIYWETGQALTTLQVGEYIAVCATLQTNPTITSNLAIIKITGGLPPSGTVVLKGGDGKIFTLDANSNVQTTSPLQFTVTITQGANNVQSANIYYYVYASSGTSQTLPLTSCGTNMYCGTLNLQPGTYVVKINITVNQGSPVTLLSILGFFNVSNPTLPSDLNYYVGLGILIVGALITLGAGFMPVRKGFP